ncbi:MAG: hypothetical protein AAGA03_04435 [Planctomycetota bacterium]
MNMMKPLIAAAAMMTIASPAYAGHNSPLYRAACQYRDAVCDFEDHVNRTRYIDRYDRRLTDDLEDATSELRSAARRPEELNRLLYAWNTVSSLHTRVELAIFDRPCYPHNPVLEQCFEKVRCALAELQKQIDCLTVAPQVHLPARHRHVEPTPLPIPPVPTHFDPRSAWPDRGYSDPYRSSRRFDDHWSRSRGSYSHHGLDAHVLARPSRSVDLPSRHGFNAGHDLDRLDRGDAGSVIASMILSRLFN